jgi:hypothetical protein
MGGTVRKPRPSRARHSDSAFRGSGTHQRNSISPHRSEIPQLARMVQDGGSATDRIRKPRRRDRVALRRGEQALDRPRTTAGATPCVPQVVTQADNHSHRILTESEHAAWLNDLDLKSEKRGTSLSVLGSTGELTNTTQAVVLETQEGVGEETMPLRHPCFGEQAAKIPPCWSVHVLHPSLDGILKRLDVPEVVSQNHEWTIWKRGNRALMVPETVARRKKRGTAYPTVLFDTENASGISPETPKLLEQTRNRMHRARLAHAGQYGVSPAIHPGVPAWLVAVGEAMGANR